jgi:NTE family protein
MVMASGTIPECYYFAKVPMYPTNEQKDQDERCIPDKSNKDKIRYFWDGGILSNTPFRELLQAHQEYWKNMKNQDRIPDLDIYIVNVHPSRMSINMIPQDYDGVKDRHNDIKYGDRTSHYDENMAHIITDYNNFVTEMKDLLTDAISKVNDKELQKRFEKILKQKLLAIKQEIMRIS